MNDTQLLRYSRQILLPELDLEGQERLLRARVLLIGLGGLGSAVAMYLAAAGIGQLILVDFDRVDLSNLQRQIIHTSADLGRLKVESAKERLLSLNPECRITTLAERLEEEALVAEVTKADVIVDGSDNFATRFAINAACVKARKPLVSAAAIRFEGQLSVFYPAREDSPCYACLYPDDEAAQAETCVETGVAAPLPGILGSLQAFEVLKLLTGAGQPLIGRLLCLDALTLKWTQLTLPKDPLCRVCGIGSLHKTSPL
ncbi:MAG TPA: molybdopterin-synthase adenylyltransferase MoeB [Gammaproteobacteria bacterium]|nr:molybdopterin-synthase adenylyltransferase MoeB [Gammaproteobacteria bacterium]